MAFAWDQYEQAPAVAAPTTATPNSGVSGTGTPQTPGTPTGTPQVAGGGGKDAFGQAWLASGGRTVDDLKAFVAAHPEYGVKLGGSKGDKVYGPDGAYWADAVISSGIGGGQGGAWNTDTGGGGGQSGNPYGFGGFGSFVTQHPEFTPPTEQDALNSPGLQFALSEANRMGQNSAAARGTLLNGRFQQALAGSNIQNALQGYGDVFGRALQTFGTNDQIKTGNQTRPFGMYYDLATLGQRAAGAS
jgi:hypothetical protein